MSYKLKTTDNTDFEEFYLGCTYFFKGIPLVLEKSYFKTALLIWSVAFLVLGCALYYLFLDWYALYLIEDPSLDFWAKMSETFYLLVKGFFILQSTYLVIVLLTTFLNTRLSEMIYISSSTKSLPQMSLYYKTIGTFQRECIKFFKISFRLAVYICVCSMLSFIPFLGLAALPTFWLLSAFYFGLLFVDYTAENVGIPYEQLIILIQKRRAIVYGFGLLCAISASIPVINGFLVPVCIAGATLLWIEQIEA